MIYLLPLLLLACSTDPPAEVPAHAHTTTPTCPAAPCKAEGLCTYSGGKCIAGGTVDCRESDVCWSEGRCETEMGKCVASFASLMGWDGGAREVDVIGYGDKQ